MTFVPVSIAVPDCTRGASGPCLPPTDIVTALMQIFGHYRATTMGITSPAMLWFYGCLGLALAMVCCVLMGTTFRRSNLLIRGGLALTMFWGLLLMVGAWFMGGRFLWPAEIPASPGVLMILIGLATTDRAAFLVVDRDRFGPLHPMTLLGVGRRLARRRYQPPPGPSAASSLPTSTSKGL